MAELSVTAGLLFMPELGGGGGSNRLSVRYPGYLQINPHAELALHLLGGYIQLCLAQPGHDGLNGTAIPVYPEGRVFFSQPG